MAVDRQRGVPYLTLRNRTGSNDPADFYGADRSEMKSGWCDVTQLELKFLAPAAEAAPFRIPDEIIRVRQIRELQRDTFWDQFEEHARGHRPVLYVHGFYIDFEKGCRRATVLQENAGLQGGLLWFSWPSDGSLLDYTRDEVDLNRSVPDLSETIIEMEEKFGKGNLNLMGHSLGARGLALALYDLSSIKPDVRVRDVVLLAPDIDIQVFRELLPRIRDLAETITIYTAPSDRPLALSAQVHGYPRLGQSGNDLSDLPDVEVIDVGDLSVRSPTGHLYHVYNEEVGDDLNQLLNEGMPAGSRRNLVKAGPNLWKLQRAR
jgi:esterase/lipase superfamily enzyme